ncbi:MAG TPA: class I SAM-dependent methyltransferase [Thermoanaerobaculia bacterium]|nr:class I SAM-dependent methyltransferase [Thermoanaerobaculia bacterium]
MKIKANWHRHLHEIRRSEIETLFARCPEGLFARGLELGAGDGFQSTLLERHVRHLVCSDLNPNRWRRSASSKIDRIVCDAEAVGATFRQDAFDLVFSSSLLEHLPRPERALRGIHRVLRDGGLSIHLLPNPLWKMSHLMLHNPNRLVSALERRARGTIPSLREEPWDAPRGNNLKLPLRVPTRRWLPVPHGVSSTNLKEFRAFSRRTWRKTFERAGFEVLAILRGPVCSGYGFGFDRARRTLERLKLSSVNAFIAIKFSKPSPHASYFLPR